MILEYRADHIRVSSWIFGDFQISNPFRRAHPARPLLPSRCATEEAAGLRNEPGLMGRPDRRNQWYDERSKGYRAYPQMERWWPRSYVRALRTRCAARRRAGMHIVPRPASRSACFLPRPDLTERSRPACPHNTRARRARLPFCQLYLLFHSYRRLLVHGPCPFTRQPSRARTRGYSLGNAIYLIIFLYVKTRFLLRISSIAIDEYPLILSRVCIFNGLYLIWSYPEIRIIIKKFISYYKRFVCKIIIDYLYITFNYKSLKKTQKSIHFF